MTCDIAARCVEYLLQGALVKMNIRNKQQPTHDGFSLVELLITLALMIALVTIITSRGSGSFQHKQLLNCERNLQNIYTAMMLYAPETNSPFPYVTNAQTSELPLSTLIPRFTTVTETFVCPGTKDRAPAGAQPLLNASISYAYYMGRNRSANADQPLMSDQQVDTTAKKAGRLLFSLDGKKPGANHDKFGGNVLFCDGSVRRSKAKAEFDLPCPTNVFLLNPRQR